MSDLWCPSIYVSGLLGPVENRTGGPGHPPTARCDPTRGPWRVPIPHRSRQSTHRGDPPLLGPWLAPGLALTPHRLTNKHLDWFSSFFLQKTRLWLALASECQTTTNPLFYNPHLICIDVKRPKKERGGVSRAYCLHAAVRQSQSPKVGCVKAEGCRGDSSLNTLVVRARGFPTGKGLDRSNSSHPKVQREWTGVIIILHTLVVRALPTGKGLDRSNSSHPKVQREWTGVIIILHTIVLPSSRFPDRERSRPPRHT